MFQHKEVVHEIQECVGIAQNTIQELHHRDPNDETLTQVGLLNGQDIIHDFLSHNELGAALEHLLYMIHESNITFDMNRVVRLHDIAKSYGIRSHYTILDE